VPNDVFVQLFFSLPPTVQPDNPADKAWKDMGVGQLSIKCKEGANKAAKESKPTIIIRNDVCSILIVLR